MASKLIKHLKEKSQEHAQLNLLVNQWEFDEKLIPKALQNIGRLFPHYSRHDVSHSLQILVNIERLLGDDINKLSATDTWLILEAAYWHDIGMVVPADTIIRDMNSPQFNRFLVEIAETNGHELQEFAKKFDIQSATACFANVDTPFEAVEKMYLLLAEFYRQQHPERAEKIVLDPWKQAGISSPRNELMPKRLFSMLGRICQLHGKDFSDVLKELEHREVGMGGENCHPRFVACLLRLGDLLDLEDNRFCPVMLRMVDRIPQSSQAHIDKHNSIRHFRLDRDRIEVTACCDNTPAYEETERWLSWLRQEIQQQMAHWQDIVPERAFGLLPTLGDLRVELDGDEQWLDFNSKERPRFDVDPEKTIELLQGAGLYQRPEQSLRELLQNAVDATLQRVWLEFSPEAGNSPLHESLKPTDWNNPYDEKITELLKLYPIKIDFKPLPNQPEGTKRKWQLTIHDHGIGISKNDLKQMRHVGGSSKNYEKKERVQRMPQWMRPSGAFGIGLQSAFMLTESVCFQTKSYLTKEIQEITLYSPLSSHRGLITIKKCESLSPERPCGSTLILTHEFEKLPARLSVRMGFESVAYEKLCHFDPISDQELEVEPANWLQEILGFAQNSPVPIRCLFKEKHYETAQYPEKQKYFFDTETNIGLEFRPCAGMAHMGQQRLYFRGQLIAEYRAKMPFLNINYHLWGAAAPDLLSINRNNIKDEGIAELEKKQHKVLLSHIRKYSPTKVGEELSRCLSAYLQVSMEQDGQTAFTEQWKDLPLVYDIENDTEKTFHDLISLESFVIYRKYPRVEAKDGRERIPSSDIPQFYNGPHSDDIGLQLLSHKLQEYNFYLQVTNINNDFIELNFSKTPFANPYNELSLKVALNPYSTKILNYYATREMMPTFLDYKKLELKVDTKINFTSLLPGAEYLRYPLMIMPFCFRRNARANIRITTEKLDALCIWTVKHAKDSTLTVDEAHGIYNKFITWIDETIMGDDLKWKKMRGLDVRPIGTPIDSEFCEIDK